MEEHVRLLEYLKRVTAELHTTRRRLHELSASIREPIAIVSTACRYPGGIRSPEGLWEFVRAGSEAVTDIPVDRGWELPRGVVRRGSFLDGHADFDAGFFGISPREALAMDPQQRLLLELAWELVERARIDPSSLRGTRTGVFVGVVSQGYASLLQDLGAEVAGHVMIGNACSVASGRLAYNLGLEGPAVTVDTACSSSLVALHLACRALRAGECSLALAGGITIMSTPAPFIEFNRQGALSEDGRCRAFAAGAAGFGLAEGVGLVLLERLSDAQANGHDVLAIVRGSAINQDGASNGLTAPNGPSQERVIRAALDEAGFSADRVAVIEAHGTGTTLGDPIEAQALLATYGQGRDPARPVLLASIKSNIGHTQAAAGVAGVIKMVEALRRQQLPASLHVDAPSPHVDWTSGAVSVLREAQAWPAGDAARCAAVSSFGISGTNAHVILEEAPRERTAEAASAASGEESAALPVALPLSGVDEVTLSAQAGRLAEHIEARPELAPAALAHALAYTRAGLHHRLVVIGSRREELLKGLRAAAAGKPAHGLVRGVGPICEPGGVVFVFPGQGSQWIGMARELMDVSPAFRNRLHACAEALSPHVEWPVLDVLRGAPGAPLLERPDVVQPALFAMMVSLAQLWREHGVEPSALVGHSQGEIAAACVAGVLSLEDAALVVGQRSRALGEIAGRGGMVAVAAAEEDVVRRIRPWGGALAIAVVNSPRSLVVSGDGTALDAFEAACAADGVRARRVAVDYPSHSPHVEVLRARLHDLLGSVTPRRGQVPICSTVLAELVDGSNMDATYWYTNLRQTVRFEAATRTLLDAGHRCFVEVSPHPVLTMAIEETAEAARSSVIALGTLRRDEGGADRLQKALAEAYVRGLDVKWAGLPARASRTPVALPTTLFRKVRYWPKVSAERLCSEAGPSRYLIDWMRVPDPGSPAPLSAGTRLLLIPAGAAATAHVQSVAAALGQGGARVVTVSIHADDVNRTALAARLAEVLRPAAAGRLDAVISLLALDPMPLANAPHVAFGLAATLALLQALGDLDLRVPLWCLTRGAVMIDPAEPEPEPHQAQIWGLGRVAALEHPGRWGGLVDLPEHLDPECQSRLAAILGGASGEDQTALRKTGIFARRMVRMSADALAATHGAGVQGARPFGSQTVLITGGTGALGAHVARHLAALGEARLLLASRHGPDAPGARQLAEELTGLGADVELVRCDVADEAAIRALSARREREGRPIRAVVHAAGVGSLVPLARANVSDLSAALAGKAAGADNLDRVFGAGAVDAFVVFSSGAGIWGGAGQGPYAAANAHIDALAARRRARGLPATAVAWGLWAGEGMGTGNAGDILRRRGMLPMSPAAAVAEFVAAVGRAEREIVVADIEWSPFLTGFQAVRPTRLFDQIPEAQRAVCDAPQPAGLDPVMEQWRLATGAGERRDLLASLVSSHIAAVLGLSGPDEVDPARAFREIGFDSLTAVELRNRLSAATGLRLPTTVVFDHPTPEALTKHLDTLASVASASVVPSSTSRNADARGVSSDEPIAIVGMGCRFPGGAVDPDSLWQLLANGVDAISAFPTDRGWNLAELAAAATGKRAPAEGGFCYDAAEFDAAFFGIAPREADLMDPQQRLTLETAWETIERAGIAPRSLRGSATAIVLGVVSQDYTERLAAASEATGYRITGGSAAVVSGRLAYVLGTEAPALTVDTACSSSLVAIHLACESLRRGEASLALAGGVTIMVNPTPFVEFSRQGGMSSDGRCHAFAASADGTGWGEGVGLVLLERLSDARARGHQVLALVRGSALNQDGASNGLTAPSGPAQQRVIQQALAAAGLSANEIDAVEAHGTGTTLGDPIEAQALLATYGQGRERPLRLGTLKSNIGHTQAAAGVAGLIKMVMALQRELLPATLHVDAPTPHVDWSAGAVQLLTEAEAWPRGERPRRAGVSAFGISGTNAHLILEEAPAARETAAPQSLGAPHGLLPFVISGREEAGLQAQAARLADHLADRPGAELSALSRSLVETRSRLEQSAVLLASRREELLSGLRALAVGERTALTVAGSVTRRPKLAFLLAGQGSQRPGMCRSLYESHPIYARSFDRICAQFDRQLAQPLASVVFSSPGSSQASLLDRTEYAQPALFATQVALARLLERYDIRPDLLLGHSIGELIAVHLAGMLSLEDACALVAARGRLMQACPSGGAMVAIEACIDEVLPLPSRNGARLSLAAVNGPRALVVSGDEEPVLELAATWTARGRRTKRIVVSHAFHSPHMEGACAALEQAAAALTWADPSLPIISNLTGARASAAALRSPDYWGRHMCETVRFAEGLRSLEEAGVTACIDLGSDGALSSQLLAAGVGLRAIPVLRAGRPEPESLLHALASVHVHGLEPSWRTFLEDAGAGDAPIVPLPTTAFQRRRHWLRPSTASARESRVVVAGTKATHPILHDVVHLADGGRVYSGRITRQAQPWLADHAVHGTAVVPGIALLDLVLVAAQGTGMERVDELTFRSPILLPHEGAVRLQLRIGPVDQGCRTVSVHSWVEPESSERGSADPEPAWTLNAAGRLTQGGRLSAAEVAFTVPPGAEPLAATDIYARLLERGYTFGPAFQSMRRAWTTPGERYGEVRLPEPYEGEAHRFAVHPALLDSAGHVRLDGLGDAAPSGSEEVPILFAVEGVELLRAGADVLRSRVREVAAGTVSMDLSDALGRPVGRIERLVVRAIPVERLRAPAGSLLRLVWSPLEQTARNGAQRPAARTALIASGACLSGAAVPADVVRHADIAALLTAVALGAPAPDQIIAVVAPPHGGREDLAAAARVAANRALELVRAFLASNLPASTRFVIATIGAVSVTRDEALRDVAAGAVWGLVRAACSEHPGRFVLVDLEDLTLLRSLFVGAVASSGAEQLALRHAGARVPKLVPVEPVRGAAAIDPQRTVLITGAAGALARSVARHLVLTRGARRLLLLARRGLLTPGMADHVAELQSLGAHVAIAACDVADGEALAAAVAAVPEAHAIGMVVHAAGVLDDGLVADMTPARVAAMMRPKVDGALHLDRLTRSHAPTDFVVFSSASATLGQAGQAGYAAANAVLDALALQRRAAGLPIRCLAWGPWADPAGMAGRLDAADARRLRRHGVRALSSPEALELFDVAHSDDSPVLLPVGLDRAALALAVREGHAPALLESLLPAEVSAAPRRSAGSLRRQIVDLPGAEREQVVLAAVRAHVARQLGHDRPEAITPDSPLLDLGFNSLMAVELRNELGAEIDLRLSATLIFEHPTPLALARHLCAAIASDLPPPCLDGCATTSTRDDLDRDFLPVHRELPLLSLEPL